MKHPDSHHSVRSRALPAHGVPLKIGLTLALLLILSGCSDGGPIRWDLHADVQRPQPGAVIFLVDGMPPRLVEQGCREGWLPNIKQRFHDSGARVRHATTTVPSITYAAIASILTGVSPPEHGVIGNRWFDPQQALFRNYATIKHYRDVNKDLAAPLIYEHLHPATSASIQAAHHRGVTHNIANWAGSGARWFFHDYTSVDKLTATSLWLVAHWANRHDRWPTLLTCYMPGADSVGHEHGPSSPQFHAALRHADYQIGRICDWLAEQSLLDTTYLVLLSDHGMVDVDQHIDLMHLVRDAWGRNATDRMLQDGPAAQRHRYFDRFDTVVNHQDGRRGSLHFRSAAGWDTPPTPELVAEILTAPPIEARLWNIPGVELAAYLAPNDEVVLRSQRGAARILTRDGPAGAQYAYIPAPDDVLGYLDDPDLAAFVTAGYHSSRDWLHASAAHMFPDLVPHLAPLLHLRRAGQVVLFTQPGYSFVVECGGHGSIHRDERLMTFMLAGPGIEPGSVIDAARVVDVVPTLLTLLGQPPDEDGCLEGVALLAAPADLHAEFKTAR